jgi:hypothetical protein
MKQPLYALDQRFVTELDLLGSPQAIRWEERLFLLQTDGAYVEVRELPAGVHADWVRLPKKEPAEHRDYGTPALRPDR